MLLKCGPNYYDITMLLWNALQLASFVSSAKVLFEYQGHELPNIGPKGIFDYPVHPNLPTDGEQLTIKDDRLVINSYPFKHTRADFHDALKFQMYTNDRFKCNSGKVTVQMTGGALMHGVEDNPFGEEPMLSQIDARLVASVFNVQDDKGQVFNFIITNARISAVIQAPFIFPPSQEEVTSTMSYNIPLVETQAGEEHTLALIFDAASQSVSWSVDGTIHYTWTVDSQIPQENCILRWGDLNRFTYPGNFAVGFGNYETLSYYPPLNDAKAFGIEYKGLVNLPFELPLFDPQSGEPAEYMTSSSEQKDHTWDRGAILRIRDIIVTYEV
ncbi:hypothetical protein PSACC_00527 [Paramicrosporidium saccamoebae]|uniref:Uncharacterized protein n=1 Tax=Paramicrosporidium saccamoebae TaxID=1246581 RepID=A0A2H9TPH1_9FUNG|nr:hypothetical protein PSACC_00527 [Paramicrosporidium saccamoebae]